MSSPSLSRKRIRKERKKLQSIFVWKTKIEEERVDKNVDEKVDGKIGDMSRGGQLLRAPVVLSHRHIVVITI